MNARSRVNECCKSFDKKPTKKRSRKPYLAPTERMKMKMVMWFVQGPCLHNVRSRKAGVHKTIRHSARSKTPRKELA